MKNVIIYILLFCGFFNIDAQTNADCINAIPLCNTPSFTFFTTSGNGSVNDIPTGNSVSNPTNNPFPPNQGCLKNGENVPQWLLITIGNPGNLEFVFGAGNSANPQVGYYDWAMWPYNSSSCAGIMNNTLPPIRCNWNATSSGGTGIASAGNIPPGGSAGNFEAPLPVSTCQQYIICISNFSGVNTLVSFLSLGSASLSCNPSCNPNYAICAGNSATIVPVNFNGLTNASYSIQPSGVSNTTGSFVVTPSGTTTYTTYITGTNSSNAIQTTTALSTVTVNPQPGLSPTFTQATCASSVNAVNLGLSFNPSGTPSYTVSWNPTPASVTSNTQTSATNLNPGVTTVTVTASGGCSTAMSFTMNSVVPPTVTLTNVSGSFSLTCNTPTINLQASSNYTSGTLNYFWSSNSFTATTQSASVTQTGTYNVCVTDPATACSACQSFTIFQNTTAPTSTVNPSTQVITCASGGVATFTGTANTPTVNVGHEWYAPGNPPPIGPPSFTSAGITSLYSSSGVVGTFTYIVRDLTNGCIVTKTISVSSTSGFPTFQTASTTNYSVGCSPLNQTTLCIVNAQSSNSAAVQFAFLSPASTATIPLPGSAFGAQSCTVTAAPGTWTFVVNDPSNSCQTAIPVQVLQNTVSPHVAADFIAPTQTLTCFNPTILATGSSTTANTFITWQQPIAPQTVSTNTIILGPGSGPATNSTNLVYANYTVVATNTINACKTLSTVVVSQNFRAPRPLISVGNPSVINCNNAPAILSFTNAAVTSSVQGAFAQVMEWSGPPPSASLASVGQYSAYVPGTYTLIVRDSYNGCTGFTTVTIADMTQPPILTTPNATQASGCGSNADLTVFLSQPLTSWSLYIKTFPPNATFFPPSATLPVGSPIFSGSTGSVITNAPGQYGYIVTNLITGCKVAGTFTVTGGKLNADLTADPLTGYAPLSVNFVNTSATSIGATSSITSVWNFGNGTSSVTTSPVASTNYTSPGTYSVMMIATRGGCSDTAFKVIKVEIPSKMAIPNVFTPNGDGNNDVFFLKTQNITEITALIYDRWGNKVYEVTSTTGNIAWDGNNSEGKECSPGTFFYIIKATGKDSVGYEQKGTVSLYR